MLINSFVRPKVAPLIPAVVHADGMARVQPINQIQQPKLHELLEVVGEYTGIPILLNTSLNLAGEPIVETAADAVDLFSRSRLDALVLGPWLLTNVPLRNMLKIPNPGLHATVPILPPSSISQLPRSRQPAALASVRGQQCD